MISPDELYVGMKILFTDSRDSTRIYLGTVTKLIGAGYYVSWVLNSDDVNNNREFFYNNSAYNTYDFLQLSNEISEKEFLAYILSKQVG